MVTRRRNTQREVFAKDVMSGNLSERDIAMVILTALGGVSATAAYRIVYDTKANGNSASVLASKKLAEPEIQEYAMWLYRYYEAGSLKFQDKIIK